MNMDNMGEEIFLWICGFRSRNNVLLSGLIETPLIDLCKKHNTTI